MTQRTRNESCKILHSAKDLKQKGRNEKRSADVTGSGRHFCDGELNSTGYNAKRHKQKTGSQCESVLFRNLFPAQFNKPLQGAILRCSLFRQGFLVVLRVGLRCLVFLVIGPIDRDFGSKFGCLLQNLLGEEYSLSSHRIAFVFRLGVIARSMQRVGQNRKQRIRYFYGSRRECPCA